MIGETERDTLLRADKIVDVEGEMPASGDLQHPTTTARRAIFSPSLRSWAMATPCVSPKWGGRSIGPQGSRRTKARLKKKSRR